MNKKYTFIVDMDSVLTQCIEYWIERINDQYKLSITKDKISHFDSLPELLAEETGMKHSIAKAACDIILNETNFFLNHKPIDGAIDGIIHLMDDYNDNIIIATKPPVNYLNTSFTEKYYWIKEHFPEHYNKMKFIGTGDKECITGDFLIDDAIHNIEKSKGIHRTIIFRQPWNTSLNETNGADYVLNSWEDIKELRKKL